MSEIKMMEWEDPTEASAPCDQEKGSEEAMFLQVYHRWVQPVYRYTLACLRNQADAEDVTSQTFLAVLKAGRPYLNSPKFQALLFRIARNKVIDLVRSQKRRAFVPLEEWILPENQTPEWTLEESLILRKAIGGLPEDDQELLRLRYIAGLEHQTIADLLGRSNAAVRKAIYRLIQRLKVEVGVQDAQ